MLNIFVGNLPFSTREAEIRELFSQHGEVTSVSLITDRETGRSRGFAFVEMANDNEGRAAIQAINGAELGGRNLVVNEARPREARGAGSGRGGYGGGNRAFGGGNRGEGGRGGFGGGGRGRDRGGRDRDQETD